MSLSVGIVGLPNVGKSTLFNALLRKQQALAANYPFATIDPNVGIVPVPDSRLEILADVVASQSSNVSNRANRPPIVPATVTFIDIAGLVAGAHKGEGLGNKFLANIREVDLICHVIRFFEDDAIHHVTGKIEPLRDKEIIEEELIYADLATLERQPQPKGAVSKEARERWDIICRLREGMDQGKLARQVLLAEETDVVRDLQLLTLKPILIVANVAEKDLSNPSIGAEIASKLNHTVTQDEVVPIAAKIEEDLSQLSLSDQKEYLVGLGVADSGLERLIKVAYDRLGLISFLTAGEKEVRAWKVRKGAKAPEAAGEIHTDFVKKFIKAEVVSFDDFVQLGGWKNCFEAGKVRLEGRDYIVCDGDVITFKIGA